MTALKKQGLGNYFQRIFLDLMIESIWESSLLGRVNMCRWGCQTVDTVKKILSKGNTIKLNQGHNRECLILTCVLLQTYMCRWCGTRYCAQCLRGDFIGLMKSSEKCRICLQVSTQPFYNMVSSIFTANVIHLQ